MQILSSFSDGILDKHSNVLEILHVLLAADADVNFSSILLLR